jgi:DNA polymerase III delta prime subunit
MNPVKLFIHSNISHLRTSCSKMLKSYLCNNPTTSDCYCKSCVLISQNAHPNTIYIQPKNSYTKDDVEPLLIYSAQKRSSADPLFFILENPEYILPSAANSLLKTLEEPGMHVFFVFLSQNIHAVLPTILSRCEQQHLGGFDDQDVFSDNDLFVLIRELYEQKPISMQKIDQVLQKKCPDKEGSLKIINDLIVQINAEAKSARKNLFINLLYQFCATPQAPGGGKLFWRTLILATLELPC